MASNYSDFLKKKKENDLQYFFGDRQYLSNKYFTFKKYINDDNIVILTNNIIIIKDSYALMTEKNKAVFLKNFQVKKVSNYYEKFNIWAVKLNRKYFKEYTFKSEFEKFYLEAPYEGFDGLVKLAKMQDDSNDAVRLGWIYKFATDEEIETLDELDNEN